MSRPSRFSFRQRRTYGAAGAEASSARGEQRPSTPAMMPPPASASRSSISKAAPSEAWCVRSVCARSAIGVARACNAAAQSRVRSRRDAVAVGTATTPPPPLPSLHDPARGRIAVDEDRTLVIEKVGFLIAAIAVQLILDALQELAYSARRHHSTAHQAGPSRSSVGARGRTWTTAPM